jgi:hypothetical protein
LSHWEDQLQAGTSRQRLAQAFWESAEHRMLEVTTYYDKLLKRTPDAAGLMQWVQMLENGASESAVEYGFLSSQEYLARYPIPVMFISAAYEDVLGRTGSALEITSWRDRFFPTAMIPTDSVPYETRLIALGILNSAEAATHLVDLDYRQFLQRAVDPIGEEYWLAAIQSGASETVLAEAILGSNEYYTRVASS